MGLVIGFLIAGLWTVALWVLVLGGFWLLSQQRKAGSIETLVLFLFFLTASVGVWGGVPGWLLVLVAVAALGAWDIGHFLHRLQLVERVEFSSGVGRSHLRRLGVVEGVGLLMGWLALFINFSISFWWEALLALLAMIGLVRLVSYVRRQVEE